MSRILVIDNDLSIQTFIRGAFRNEGYEIDVAANAETAFTCLAESPPDLIILDLTLPGQDGYSILNIIRKERLYDAIPVILLSVSDDLQGKIKGLDLGAVEYLVKPIPAEELAARVRALLRLKKRQDRIFAEYERLSEISLTDPLTGAYNRRALDTFLKARLAESSRHNIPVSCVMFDLDHFKQVNDTYGHDIGDLVLQEISEVALTLFRKEDAIRYGGEEFLIILFHTSKTGAHIFAERLRERVASRVFTEVRQPLRLTLSAGIAAFPEDEDVREPDSMITLADKRLYAAKHAGRNQVVSDA